MVDGQFIQIASVALHLHQGTVRETMVTALYALDSLGNVWKLIDQSGQKWTLMTNEVRRARDKDARSKLSLAGAGPITPESVKLNREATAVDR